MEQANPLGIKRIDHVHFYVRNMSRFAERYITKFNFSRIAAATDVCFGVPQYIKCSSVVISQNRINFIVTQPNMAYENKVTKHVLRHGDGVHDVAFLVEDAGIALEIADHVELVS
jgi:4-hydroxyphenylpyruvate dioxygenase